ncbi:laccase [Coniophora puteana RWD-64-598 SS2]|uniref:Laccase n=1 Tax=Coniophora puteana (strain RWD-64-598) TaxID=741705 RepID=A0A5M3M893_CONPW|nr:laccase [Coniophora puteana RWD-64-598 SS2]EIW75389.1 laccase [Coniophora puteana RWD-64-598 SS2]
MVACIPFFSLAASLLLSNAPVVSGASIVSRTTALQVLHASRSDVLNATTELPIVNRAISPDGYNRSATLAGGTLPGPLIAANKGDDFRINVTNQMTDPSMYLSTTVHWHGIYQNGTNYNDGTAFVTQCPIPANDSFLYKFSANNQAGTYWYHSHYTTQYCDGLSGPLVIYDPEDPMADMYDVDDETTVITLQDWYHFPAPVDNRILGISPNSTLINGLGRYAGGPASPLANITVQQGKRYRFRLVSLSCDPTFTFSIDGHNFTIIEADGQLTEPLTVDSLQILAGQRYSIVLNATDPDPQANGNYWIRAMPNTGNAAGTFAGGLNMAVLRYEGAADVDPTTQQAKSVNPLLESNLHAFINPGAPGVPELGQADINLAMIVDNRKGTYYINNATFVNPTVPVLLQILSGKYAATDLLPEGTVYVLEPNKTVELHMWNGEGFAGPHPIHLHGHSFDVIRSAGSDIVNFKNPVRRDVVSSGTQGQGMVIRWTTDNSGPWFLHCHINWHLEAGFAVVFAENPSGTKQHIGHVPEAWENLCPAYNALSPSQLGGVVPPL